MASALVFKQAMSDPEDAVRLATCAMPECAPAQVLVQMLAAPVNPLDLLVLQGKYPVKPQNFIGEEMIAGSDGAGRIVGRGQEVRGLDVGDLVVLKQHCRGSWRTHAALEADDVLRVPRGLGPQLAAIMRMGIMPAYFQLEDYHPLHPGDWVIQNAGTGVIAHFVAQFASLRGLKVISVIRDRENADAIKRSLKSHGATMAITETELDTTSELDGKRIALAIDSVSGAVSAKMASKMAKDSTFLTTGFLAGPQASPPVDWKSLGWTKGVTFKGFRLSSCIEARSTEQNESLVGWFAELFERQVLHRPLLEGIAWRTEEGALEDKLKHAIRSTRDAPVGRHKAVLMFDNKDELH